MWLKRFISRMRRRGVRAHETDQQRRIEAHLRAAGAYDEPAELLDAALRDLDKETSLDDATLRSLITHLRGIYGDGAADEAHARFWHELASRFDSPLAKACHADTLLALGRGEAAMAAFLAALDAQPTLLYEFGGELYDLANRMGGEHWLRYQIACLQAAIADYEDSQDEDYIREIYSELLEEHGAEPTAVERIRRVGQQIDRLVAEGRLPRALVRRGTSRT